MLAPRKTSCVIRWLELWASLTSMNRRGLEIEFKHVANDLFSHAVVVKPQ